MEGEGVSYRVECHKGLPETGVEGRTQRGLQLLLQLSHQLLLTSLQLLLGTGSPCVWDESRV